MTSWTRKGGALAALAVGGAALAFITGGAACGGNVFDSSLTGDGGGPGTEGGGGDGPTGDSPTGDAGDGGSTGPILYVSNTTGDDTQSGFDPKHPKRTIASALTKAATISGTVPEVHVCAGNYAETALTVSADVNLMGAYDCVSWMRTSGFGYPTFDGTNATVVTNAAPATQPATLVVRGAVTGGMGGTHIGGFFIQGAAPSGATSVGIDIQGGASPAIENDVISGGGGTVSTGSFGSVGVQIGGSSAAEVDRDGIVGGTGTGAAGSVGIVIASTGKPSVHDDTVSGGSGKTTGATPNVAALGVAILSSLDPSKPLASMFIGAADAAGVGKTSVGVLVQGTGVDAIIAASDIEGGKGDGPMTASVGVDVETTGSATIVDNRIFGGLRTGAGAQTAGVHVGMPCTFVLGNNEIHAGDATGGTGATSIGVDVHASAAPAIDDNTIYAGEIAGALPLMLEANVTAAKVEGNLLLGSGPSSGGNAIYASNCMGTLAAVDHVGFANFATVYQCGTSPGNQTAPDPGTMASLLGTSVDTIGNVELLTSCPVASWCVASASCPSTGTTACAQSLFGSTWSAGDDGVTGLFYTPGSDGGAALGGWKYAADNPCALARGGATLSSYGTDLFGVTRGTTPSIGAAQDTAACK